MQYFRKYFLFPPLSDEILLRFTIGKDVVEKKDLWKQCQTAISQMCKRARTTMQRKFHARRGSDQAVEHVGELEYQLEGDNTGSETSFSDREEAHFLQSSHDIHMDSQEWAPRSGDSDITIVHLPSEVCGKSSVLGQVVDVCSGLSSTRDTESPTGDEIAQGRHR